MTGKHLSIIIPVYNEVEVLPELLARLERIAASLSSEFQLTVDFIFVDDGSTDDSFAVLSAHDFGPRSVRLLQFSRNFGKEAALSAGIDAAQSADAAVLMDADLQHPPEMITEFVRIWLNDGADSVYAYKASRRNSEGYLKAAASRLFFWVINRNIRYQIPPGAGDFRLINHRFMKALRSLPESDRFMKGLYGWVGFRQTGLPLEPPMREHGQSSFSAFRLFSMTMDAITSFTTTPLRLMAMAGIFIAMFSAAYGLFVVIETLFFTGVSNGIASVLTLIAFFGGMQMIFLGLLGEYIGKSVQEAKKRPSYILAEDITRKGEEVADR
ncbi:glycosyltransferase family 2 protein [uncultured Hoeflea sp.]|uniref:glycosyltransferase family 2 protein n=1 Tax=uncultured Hoeflea sp. TaxID=538666 RepID=UPI0030ED8418|tara:strand:+ start:12411 stop:13388 length:978 start_codon:yes stop_codon:yes gene_type:complete